ncbi:DinB family protein [Paenibacillus aurantius]|uniref:DinB family protein n=1 Tax=Paenibacillus aurantius TaxID=2918900 RepID=A0AA96LJG6_9BACL|nr:DinB family protein [Paenibacillus aurantius]WNQ12617.1 DinB family protein [Paenibacillus aurantius]
MRIMENDIAPFEAGIPWLNSLRAMDESFFFAPIAEGKWSPAQIVSHLTAWDRVLSRQILPQVKDGAEVESRDYRDWQTVNEAAAIYALEGISAAGLLDEAVEARRELVRAIRECDAPPEARFRIAHGTEGFMEETFSGLLLDFTRHDRHHRQQVDEVWKVEKP